MVAGAPVLISNRVQIWDTIRETDSGWVVPCKMEAIAAALLSVVMLTMLVGPHVYVRTRLPRQPVALAARVAGQPEPQDADAPDDD